LSHLVICAEPLPINFANHYLYCETAGQNYLQIAGGFWNLP